MAKVHNCSNVPTEQRKKTYPGQNLTGLPVSGSLKTTPPEAPNLDRCKQPWNSTEYQHVKKDSEYIRSKAFSKIHNDLVFHSLLELETPLWKDYILANSCANYIIKKGDAVNFLSCNKRGCKICQKRRTAILINSYKGVLLQFTDPVFLTLTVKNMDYDQLPLSINLMLIKFNRIKDRLRKQGHKIQALRKLEITWSDSKLYHPHYHLIVEGKNYADSFLIEWLKEFPSSNAKGQNIRSITNEKGMFELFKYSIKDFKYNAFNAVAIDTMYQAIKGKRIFQPIGLKMTKKETEQAALAEGEEIEKTCHNFTDDGKLVSDGGYSWRKGLWCSSDGEVMIQKEFTKDQNKAISKIDLLRTVEIEIRKKENKTGSLPNIMHKKRPVLLGAF